MATLSRPAPPRAHAVPKAPELSGLAVLIVEESMAFRTLIKAMLQKLGIRDVVAVESQSAALEQLKARSFDVLLYGLIGPGADLIVSARRLAPKIKVILIAADKKIAPEVTNAGISGALFKPFSLSELQAALQNAGTPSAGFSGQVQELSLVDVLQMYHNSRRSITVSLAGPIAGRIMMAGGEIVHAESQEASGLAALARLLGATTGMIDTSLSRETSVRTIDGSFPFVLLEASRQLDERRHMGELAAGYADDGVTPPTMPAHAATAALLASEEVSEDADDKTIVDLPSPEEPRRESVTSVPLRAGYFPVVASAGLGTDTVPPRSASPTNPGLKRSTTMSVASPIPRAPAPTRSRPKHWVLAAGLAFALIATYWYVREDPSSPSEPVSAEQAEAAHPSMSAPVTSALEPRVSVRTFALSIDSDPAEAIVTEGGKVLGSTPLELPIERESVVSEPRRFVVKRPGYAPYVLTQGDSDKSVEVSVTLSRGALAGVPARGRSPARKAPDAPTAHVNEGPPAADSLPAKPAPAVAPPARRSDGSTLEIRLRR